MSMSLDETDEIDTETDPWDSVPDNAAHVFDEHNQPTGFAPLPEGFVAWVEYEDTGPESPREWCNVAKFVTTHRNYTIEEDETWFSALRQFEEYGHDPRVDADDAPDESFEQFAERYAREELDAIVVDTFYAGNHGEATVWAYVSAAEALAHLVHKPEPGDSIEQVDAFLEADLEPLARAALEGEINVYNQWANGEVYTVVVERDGKQETLSGCYDGEGGKNFPYLRSVVDELIKELS